MKFPKDIPYRKILLVTGFFWPPEEYLRRSVEAREADKTAPWFTVPRSLAETQVPECTPWIAVIETVETDILGICYDPAGISSLVGSFDSMHLRFGKRYIRSQSLQIAVSGQVDYRFSREDSGLQAGWTGSYQYHGASGGPANCGISAATLEFLYKIFSAKELPMIFPFLVQTIMGDTEERKITNESTMASEWHTVVEQGLEFLQKK